MDKVYIKKCESYDYDLIYSIIKDSIEKLGGIEKYIKPNETVFIKANLLMAEKPEKGVTTHPTFVKAVGNYLINENNNEVIVGDSPGGPYNQKALMKVYKECGYIDAFIDTDIKLNMNFDSRKISFDGGKLLKSITLIDGILNVDKVISLSKLKTHGMMKYTGAVKNMFGTIPGILKAEFHFKMPKVENFADMLIDVCLASKPVLSFMDGIVGMEGAGPSGGDIVKSEVVLVSDNPFALDLVATNLIGMEAITVPTINNSINRNLITDDIDDIKILGDEISSFSIKPFITPKINKIDFLDNILPKKMARMINNYIKPKPIFNLDKCVKCRICYDSCPANTIIMDKGEYPKLNVNGCISCFCCQELCPENAIDIKRPWILDKILND
jgi:uncharacterized protein (DUF362 family)/Pyruvate/2-oxoacid:ferredoxin oxidoreductase delta subunit